MNILKNKVTLILLIIFSKICSLFSSCTILSISQNEIDDLTEKFDNDTLLDNEKKRIKKYI